MAGSMSVIEIIVKGRLRFGLPFLPPDGVAAEVKP